MTIKCEGNVYLFLVRLYGETSFKDDTSGRPYVRDETLGIYLDDEGAESMFRRMSADPICFFGEDEIVYEATLFLERWIVGDCGMAMLDSVIEEIDYKAAWGFKPLPLAGPGARRFAQHFDLRSEFFVHSDKFEIGY